MTNQKLKIVYFDGAIAFGGTITLLKMIFNDLDRNVIEPRLVTALPKEELLKHFKAGDIASKYTPRLSYVSKDKLNKLICWLPSLVRKLSIYIFTAISLLANIPTSINIFFTLYKERPDILHVNNSNSPLITAYLLKIPVIWHFHGAPQQQSFFYKLLHSKIVRYLSISDYIQQKAVEAGYPAGKISTIHNPAPKQYTPKLSFDNFCSHYKIDSHKLIITHIGRLIPWKGQLEFLKAFALALKENSKIHALIIGEDTENYGSLYKSQLLEVIEKNKLSNNITLLGQVDSPLEALSHSSIVVHTSLEPEPFGLVITEAMSAGTAVICSNRGAGSEIINDGISGIVCDPEDIEKLKTSMLALVADKDLRDRIALTAQQHSQTRFALEQYIKNLTDLYKSILLNYKTKKE